MSDHIIEHVKGASTVNIGGANAKPPKVIEQIFANRVPSKVEALFAAAETAGPGKYIPISVVDEALVGIDVEKRLVIKTELRQRGAIA